MSEHPEYIRGVKDCIARLPNPSTVPGGSKWDTYAACMAALQLLLKEATMDKPDHAKAAVEAYGNDYTPKDAVDCDFTLYTRVCITNFARWLEQQGVDLSRWGE